MRNKILMTLLVLSVGFLLLSNPVVSQAAGKISGSQITKNSIRSKQVRNGSLRAIDFRPGQLPHGPQGPQGRQGLQGAQGPDGVMAVKRLEGQIDTLVSDGTYHFAGPSVTVTVAPGQAVVASGTVTLGANGGESTVADVGVCAQAGGGPLSLLGDADSYHASVHVNDSYTIVPIDVAGTLAPGSYSVGMCVHPAATLPNNDFEIGWLQVVDTGSSPLVSKAGGTGVSRR
jgi:hypothetical protein